MATWTPDPSSYLSPRMTANQRAGGRWLWRTLAATVVALVLALLYWGAFAQEPRLNPFRSPDFSSWFWHRLPHDGHVEMPVRPVGSQGGLVPRDLCAEERCAGLETADDGRATLRVENRVETMARVRHTASGHLFAVSAAGAVWHLGQGDGGAPTWRQTELPVSNSVREAPEITIEGHGGTVTSAGFDPTGERIVTASADGTARLWDAASGEQQAVLQGHQGTIWSAVFDPTGARVLTASGDGTARLWGADSGQQLAVLQGHQDEVLSAAFDPTGERVLTASVDGTVRLWDAASGQQLGVLEGYQGPAWSAVFDPTGARVLIASVDGSAELGDLSGKQFTVFKGHEDFVRSAVFDPTGARVLTASGDGTVRLWGADSGQQLAVLEGHQDEVLSAAFDPTGERALTASVDGTARLWDAASGKQLAVFEGHQGSVTFAVFDPTGARVLTASADRTARVWRSPLPVVTDVAMQGVALWLVGHDGYVARTDQQGLASAEPGLARDLFGIAALPGGDAVAVGADGLFVRLQQQQPQQPRQLVQVPDLVGLLLDDARAAHPELSIEEAGRERSDERRNTILRQEPMPGAALPGDREFWIVRVWLAEEVPNSQAQQQAPQQVEVRAADPSPGVGGAGSTPSDGKASRLVATVTHIEVAGDAALRAVRFLDNERGWIAGDRGLLLHTANGGESWQVLHRQPEGAGAGEDRAPYALSDVHVQAGGLGWAVGETPDGRRVVLAAEDAASPESWRELPHHVAPWWFFLGIPAFIFASFLNAWAWRLEPPPPAASITGAGTSDKPLSWRDPDACALHPLARGLSRFLRNANTEPPLTVAITGRWGSGKSSLMNLLQEDLARVGARPVWFNAWHHRDEEHLLAALFQAVRRQGPPPFWLASGLGFRVRLLLQRGRAMFTGASFLLLFAVVTYVTIRVSLPHLDATDANEVMQRVAMWLDGNGDLANFFRDWGAEIAASGGLALVTLWMRAKLVALPANPAKLAAAVARRASIGDLSDKLSFRDRFGQQFSEVCRALRTRTSPGLVILIDDLDRCQPDDTLKILEAVNYFVSAGPCIVVLGMDRRQVEYCVGLGFERLVEGLPEDELIYEELTEGAEGPALRVAKQRAFARHYLEKLINIEVPVPELSAEVLEAMLGGPEQERRPAAEQLAQGAQAGPRWRRLAARFRQSRAAQARKTSEQPPPWLDGLKRTLGLSTQVARVGVFAFVLGWISVWGIEKVGELPARDSGTEEPVETAHVAPETTAPLSAATTKAALGAPDEQSRAPVFSVEDLSRVDAPGAIVGDIPSGRRWIWWLPAVLALLVAGLWGVGVFIRYQRQLVEDSQPFKQALAAVRPLLKQANPTPRAIKRYQNRMRYLAERLRPQFHEPDAIDTFLHWLGRSMGWSLVPEVWFENQPRTTISEPALILLGAIEVFSPQTLEEPAEKVLETLDLDDTRSLPGRRQARLWREVKQDFYRRFPEASYPAAWPSVDDIQTYQAFVRGGGRQTGSHGQPHPPADQPKGSRPRVVTGSGD